MTRRGKTKKPTAELQESAPGTGDSGSVAVKKSHQQLENEAILAIQKVTGTRSDDAGARLVHQAANALVWPNLKQEDAIIKTVAFMAEMEPQNATEAMLAVQMIATNETALLFLRRAVLEGQTFEGSDANVLRATRLMRLFNQQLEAMQKLKGKAVQQKVTVEHVHVHEGGQAIVGAVSAPKGGG